jgi:DNA-binding CsgD family transcriptional regulator
MALNSQHSNGAPSPKEALASQWAKRWFEMDRLPVMVVGFDGRVIDANPAGRRVIDDGDVAGFEAGVLGFDEETAQHAFHAALDTVAAGEEEEASTIVRCNDSILRRIEVTRRGASGMDAAFVVLHGIGHRRTDFSVLAAAMGFTRAERRILTMLAEGASPKSIAAELRISPHTVRVHLRRVYGKMRVHGMYHLVRECTRLTA